MVTCHKDKLHSSTATWIIDSGASAHMTSSSHTLSNLRHVASHMTINLPTGDDSQITHMGDAVLPNGLILKNVLVVIQFKHNLLSIHILARDNNC